MLDTQEYPGLDEMNTYGPENPLVASGRNSDAEALEMMLSYTRGQC